jgi:uncharacterized coiled-coil protein SlyX
LLRDSVATESIYGFALEQANVSPEEPIFVLTGSQLQSIIHEATKSLESRVDALESRIIQQSDELAALKATETENFRILTHDDRDIWEALGEIDRKISKTYTSQPRGDKTVARILKLKDALKSRCQGMTLKEVGKLLGMRPNQVTALVLHLDKRVFEIFTRSGDARQKVIRLRSFT